MSVHRHLFFSRLSFEELEDRRLLTTLSPPYTPTEIRVAYGLAASNGTNQLSFGSTNADGTGQTIALLELNNTRTTTQLQADLHTFDTNATVNLPDSTVTVFDAPGITPASPTTDVIGEEDLDMEWAHAIAPGANIYIVMVPVVNGTAEMLQIDVAAQYAASLPGVSVVSISYALTNRSTSGAGQGTPPFPYAPTEFSTETAENSYFTTPSGHQGVTFIASTGDDGTASWPATSPNVLAVGGTTLSMTTATTTATPPVTTYAYAGETYWNAPKGGTYASGIFGVGGAGLSQFEAEPSYQQGFQSSGFRSVPDVAMDADFDDTPVEFYINDPSTGSGMTSIGPGSGLSAQLTAGLPAPMMAGILAIVNQGRVLMGGTTLDGPSQTLPALYSVSSNDYNAMTTVAAIPNTTISATGLGSPIANLLIPDLAAYDNANRLVVSGIPATIPAGSIYPIAIAAEDTLGAVDDGASGSVLINGSETQIVTFTSPLTTTATGFFSLVVDGVTVGVNYPSAASQANMITAIQNALNGATLPLGAGNTSVAAGPSGSMIAISFTGKLANVKVPQISSSNGTLSGNSVTIAPPEVLAFANPLTTPGTGTFNLVVNGVAVAVSYPATASQANMVAAVQSALDSAASPLGPGNTLVSAGPTLSTIIISFLGLAASGTAPQITFTNGTLNESQTLTFTSALTTSATGTFNIIINGTDIPVAYPATPTQANMVVAIQAALDGAAAPLGPGATIVSAGFSLSTITITFAGALANSGAPQVSSSNGTLSGNSVSSALPQVITFASPLTTAATGSFNLVVDGVTVPINYPAVGSQGAMVATIQIALDSAAAPLGAGTTLVASGATTSTVTITYIGSLAMASVAPITFNNNTLRGNTITTINPSGAGNLVTSFAGPQFANGKATVFVVAPTKSSLGSPVQISADGLKTTIAVKVGASGSDHFVVSTEPPGSVDTGALFGLTVSAVDGYGNLDTGFGGTVTVALANNPNSATLGGTLTQNFAAGLATFSDLTVSADGLGYTLSLTSQSFAAVTSPINVFNTLTLAGSPQENVSISFPDAQDFIVSRNGVPTEYALSQYNRLIYQGPSQAFSSVVFDDPTDTYAATQTFSSTQILSSSFAFEADNVANLYIYAGSASTAAVTVGGGAAGNYYVDAANGGYSYIADPVDGIFSQLIGFGAETVTGSGGSTYAYVYSTSQASVVANPNGSSITVGGVKTTLVTFPQMYVVGAADGTDQIQLVPGGSVNAQFVATPDFSYITGLFKTASFIFGTLDAANVVAQPSQYATDTAYFESYPGNAFNASPTVGTLSGTTTSTAGTSFNFSVQAQGFLSVAVLESGSGTDSVHLSSTGGAVFVGTSTADTLTIGLTTITINTYIASTSGSGTVFVAAAGQVTVTGAGDGSDVAFLYDSPGGNAVVASGTAATLTTDNGSTTVDQFGAVTLEQQNGTTDTLHESAVDFAVATVGNWTRV